MRTNTYQMVSEHKMIFHLNNIFLVLRIIVSQIFKDLQFYHALLVKSFFVSNDFNGSHLLDLVVEAFYHLNWEFCLTTPKDPFPSVLNTSNLKLIWSWASKRNSPSSLSNPSFFTPFGSEWFNLNFLSIIFKKNI